MTDSTQEKSKLLASFVRSLPIVAFIAAAIYLWRGDFAPDIHVVSIPLLLVASAIQLLAFTVRAWLFRDFLGRFGIALNFPASIVCIFKPILSKYIPGKVWLLVSTAGQLDKQGVPFGRASIVVGIFQVSLAISGLILGALALVVFQLPGVDAGNRLLLITLPMVMLLFLLGSRGFLDRALPHIPKLREWSSNLGGFPSLSLPAFYGVVHWLVIGLAFTFFLLSVGVNVGWYPILFQPMAINIGVLAVFVPGGLGVREGAMAAYLALANIPLKHGIALAVAARFWFFAGELTAFIIGMVMDQFGQRK